MTAISSEADARTNEPVAPKSETTHFQHESEQQFAALLDFYRIEWEYEPTTFVFTRDADGNPTSAFSPDFYLPAEDTYIEITTMNQNLVRRKNKKLRMLRQHYPEINCKLFYQRDFEALLVKYGLVTPES